MTYTFLGHSFTLPLNGQSKPETLASLEGKLIARRDGDILTFDFDNSAASAAIAFAGAFSVRIEFNGATNPVTFQPTTFFTGVSLTLRLPGGLNGVFISALAFPRPANSFDLFAPSHEFAKSLGKSQAISEAKVMRHDRFAWSRSGGGVAYMRLSWNGAQWRAERDIEGETLSEAEISDYIAESTDPGIVPQRLRLVNVSCNPQAIGKANGLSMRLRPTEAALHVAPHALSSIDPASDENPILHSLSLANGELGVSASADVVGSKGELADLAWHGNGTSPLVIFNQLRDENTLPLAAEVKDKILLRSRPDARSIGDDTATAPIFGGLDLGELQLSGVLRSLRVDTSGEAATALDAKPLIEKRRYICRDDPPGQIHGFTRNSFLKFDGVPSAPDGHPIKLSTVAVVRGAGAGEPDIAFTIPHIGLAADKDAGKWSLVSIYDERTFVDAANANTPAKAFAVGRREISQQAPFELYGIDVRLVLANLAPGNVARQTAQAFRKVDAGLLSTFPAFPQGNAQEHLRGFRLAPQSSNVELDTILGPLRETAARLSETRLEPLSSKATPRTYEFGARTPPGGLSTSSAQPTSNPLLTAQWEVARRLRLLEYLIDGNDKLLEIPKGVDPPPQYEQDERKLRGEIDKVKAELHQHRFRMMEELEGNGPVAAEIEQILWTLSLCEAADLKLLTSAMVGDWAQFEAPWKSAPADQPFGRIANKIAVIVGNWPTIPNNPTDPAVRPAVRPVHHRVMLALARLAPSGLLSDTAGDLYVVLSPGKPDSLQQVIQKAGANWRELLRAMWSGVSATPLGKLASLRRGLLATLPATNQVVARLAAGLPAWTDVVPKMPLTAAYLSKLSDQLATLRSFPHIELAVPHGRDEPLRLLKSLWNDPDGFCTGSTLPDCAAGVAAFKALMPTISDRDFYSDEILSRIVGQSEDAKNLVAKLLKLGERSGALLASLRVEPPDYIVLGRRFHVAIPTGLESVVGQLQALWGRNFELCRLGQLDAWDFNLDGETTIILKLSDKLSLRQVLTAVQTSFASDFREPDPLGLNSSDLNVDPGKTQDLVDAWCRSYLDSDLEDPAWLGILVLNPVADLERNKVCRDLCGIRYLRGRYVAVGGRATAFGRDEALDLYATIFAREDKPKTSPSDERKMDSRLALVKFDARIKNTRLRGNSSIELRLNVEQLFGRLKSDPESAGKYEGISILGSVKMPEKGDQSPTFTFAALFNPPREMPIGIGFIKALELRSVVAAVRNGETALEIDADILLDDFKVGSFSFLGKAGKILLSGLRLVFPKAADVGDQAIGILRAMMLDLDGLDLRFPTPRSLTFGSLELHLAGLGYARGIGLPTDAQWKDKSTKAVERLKARYSPLFGSDPFAIDPAGHLPFVEFDVDFGELPKLGASAIRDLRLTLLVGFHRKNDGSIVPVVAIGGFDAQGIDIDLFRILKLTIARMFFQAEVPSGLDGKIYSVLGAQDIRLSLLGMDLIGKPGAGGYGADLLMLQDRSGGRGTLVYVRSPIKSSLVTIDWILLARNLNFEPELFNWLMMGRGKPIGGVVDRLVERTGENPPKITKIGAALSGKNDWLFGIAFAIGKLIEDCRLLMQDQTYYGVRLQAPWVKPLFGVESIALAYIPGPTPRQDRFLLEMPLPSIDLFMQMRSGWATLSWAVNTDALIALGFPFRSGARYMWERAFSSIVGIYEYKFGFYIEKKTEPVPDGNELTIGGGIAFSVGYGVALGTSFLWVRAGIGVFVIVEGSATIRIDNGTFGVSVVGFSVRGTAGIFAYVEGGIDIWIVSARFRAEIQASLSVEISSYRGSIASKRKPLMISYDATLYAGYYATASVNMGLFSVSFTVEGNYPISVAGQKLLEGGT